MANDEAPSHRPHEPALFALRRHLALRAELEAGPLRGSLDEVTAQGVAGWVADDNAAGAPVAIEVTIDGCVYPPLVADGFRADLARAGIGDGHHAFRLAFATPPLGTRQHFIRVRRAFDGADLPGSPAVLDRAPHHRVVIEQTADIVALCLSCESLVQNLTDQMERIQF
jgi:hypothetical protein